MDLTIAEAAALLGRSDRQVRYMIKKGRLEARKQDGRWVIREGDLPLSEGQRASRAAKAAQLQDAVESALGPHLAASKGRRYSVEDLPGFMVLLGCARRSTEALGVQHPASAALVAAVTDMACGCHRFHKRDKLDAYTAAREEAAAAVAALLLHEEAPARELAGLVEQEVMPALAGLARRNERKRR